MNFIKLTKKNIESINCNEVAFYSFSEKGAMGVHAGIEIITFDNKKYKGTYAYGELNLTNYYRVLPLLNGRGREVNEYFECIYLGMGNRLFIRKEISKEFIELIEKEIPDYNNKPGILYQKWRELANLYLSTIEKSSLKEIKIIEEERLNPFKCMGFDIDINDRKTQSRIINYLEKYSKNNFDGYNYRCINAYSIKNSGDGIQFHGTRNNEDMTLTEKMDNLVIHHTNSIVWKCELDARILNDNEFIVKPNVKNNHGAAYITFINTATTPYLKEGFCYDAQINCYGYDVRVFKGDERYSHNENNFKFFYNDKENPIYLNDNSIIIAGAAFKEKKYNRLNLIRGDVLCVRNYTSKFFGQKRTYQILYVDTIFGITPIICNKNVLSYCNGDNIYPGDKIEALCSIVGDIMLHHEYMKTNRDRSSYFDIIKKAFELKDMSYLNGILADDCIYKSDTNHLEGKNNIIEGLQNIASTGYKDKDYSMEYCIIRENPVKNFKIDEEVLCIRFTNDYSVEGEINFHMNRKKMIDKIYLTNDKNIKFCVYSNNGNFGLDEEENKKYDELISLMKKREFTDEQIGNILNMSAESMFIVDKIMEFIKPRRQSDHLYNDLFNYTLDFFNKYVEEHPHRSEIKHNYYVKKERERYQPKLFIWL